MLKIDMWQKQTVDYSDCRGDVDQTVIGHGDQEGGEIETRDDACGNQENAHFYKTPDRIRSLPKIYIFSKADQVTNPDTK